MTGHPARAAGMALIMMVVAGACAKTGSGGSGGDTIPHPTGPDQLVLRVETGGGFVPSEMSLTEVPRFSLYGDGRVVVTGPQIEIYPGPALPNLQSRTVDEAGVQAILLAAREAGLEGADRRYEGNKRVADAGTTTFTVAANGGVHTTSVYALFDSEESAGVSEGGARGPAEAHGVRPGPR